MLFSVDPVGPVGPPGTHAPSGNSGTSGPSEHPARVVTATLSTYFNLYSRVKKGALWYSSRM